MAPTNNRRSMSSLPPPKKHNKKRKKANVIETQKIIKELQSREGSNELSHLLIHHDNNNMTKQPCRYQNRTRDHNDNNTVSPLLHSDNNYNSIPRDESNESRLDHHQIQPFTQSEEHEEVDDYLSQNNLQTCVIKDDNTILLESPDPELPTIQKTTTSTTTSTLISTTNVNTTTSSNISSNISSSTNSNVNDNIVISNPTLKKLKLNVIFKKGSSIYKWDKNGIELGLRKHVTDYSVKNNVRLVGKACRMNFDFSRNKHDNSFEQNSNVRTSQRLVKALQNDNDSVCTDDSDNDNQMVSNQMLHGYHRCLLEDFMGLKPDDKIYVLIPITSHRYNVIITREDDLIAFGDKTYAVYKCKVTNAPNNERVMNGIDWKDLKLGMGSHNFGCSVVFLNSACILKEETNITWSQILHGRDDGIQAWKKGYLCRDLFQTFRSRRRTNGGLAAILSVLYYELFGDRDQMLLLQNCYYRSSLQSEKESSALKERRYNDSITIDKCAHSEQAKKEERLRLEIPMEMVLYGTEFDYVIKSIEESFLAGIEACFYEFSSFGEGIISHEEIERLIHIYSEKMPHHYNGTKKILGYDKKMKLQRNKHLQVVKHYEKKLFFKLITDSRIVNKNNFIYWAIISAGAFYARGIIGSATNQGVYHGSSSHYLTMKRKLSAMSDGMTKKINAALSKEEIVFGAIDNNQKGHNIKYQRGGASNVFVRVTGRYFRKATKFNLPQVSEQEGKYIGKTPITYLRQKQPSMFRMPRYEDIDMTSKDEILDFIMNFDDGRKQVISDDERDIDFSGDRVGVYLTILNITRTASYVIGRYGSNYKRKKKEYKPWNHQPEEFKTDFRITLSMRLKQQKELISDSFRTFQRRSIRVFNPEIKKKSKLIIPKVSLRDEMQTTGYGKALVELLELCDIVVQKVDIFYNISWVLCEGYEKRQLYLCMDGLTLDRHRSFTKKLKDIPQSFSKNFEQSLVFQKALSRVVEIGGQLHIAFHMLQSIFNIFKWFIELGIETVAWKKIKTSKVSDCFQMSMELCMLLLEETERYLFDVFATSYLDEVTQARIERCDGKDLIIILSGLFNRFLDQNEWMAGNAVKKMLVNFVRIASKFRLYWESIREGDRVVQEKVLIDWLGIFLILGKSNYVEITLSTIEKEYSCMNYCSLEDIRRNCFVRYTESVDNNAKKEGAFRTVALDECMEMINGWTKKMPIGNSEEKWVENSDKIMFARKCVEFENLMYKNHEYEFNSDQTELMRKRNSNKRRTTTPKSTAEKSRVYEMIHLLCSRSNVNVNSGNLSIERAKSFISILQTQLHAPKSNDTTEPGTDDAMDVSFDIMFSNENRINDTFTSASLNHDRSGIGDDENIDYAIESIDEETAEEEVVEEDNSNGTYDSDDGRKISKLAIDNIFSKADEQLLKLDVGRIRGNFKNRLHRSELFYRNVNDEVKNLLDTINTTILTIEVDDNHHKNIAHKMYTDEKVTLTLTHNYAITIWGVTIGMPAQ